MNTSVDIKQTSKIKMKRSKQAMRTNSTTFEITWHMAIEKIFFLAKGFQNFDILSKNE